LKFPQSGGIDVLFPDPAGERFHLGGIGIAERHDGHILDLEELTRKIVGAPAAADHADPYRVVGTLSVARAGKCGEAAELHQVPSGNPGRWVGEMHEMKVFESGMMDGPSIGKSSYEAGA
jgi:hypothetical protein